MCVINRFIAELLLCVYANNYYVLVYVGLKICECVGCISVHVYLLVLFIYASIFWTNKYNWRVYL